MLLIRGSVGIMFLKADHGHGRSQDARHFNLRRESTWQDRQIFRVAQACFHCSSSGSEASRKRRRSKHIFYQRRYSLHACLPTSLLCHYRILSQQTTRRLSLGLEGVGEAAHVVLKGTLGGEELDVGTVDADLALLALGDVLLAAEGSEAPVLGDDDLLATGELVLGTAESLDDVSAV